MSFGLALAIAIKIFSAIEWIPALLRGGLYYLLTAIVFVLGMVAAGFWIRKIRHVKFAGLVYVLVAFGLAILFYLSVTSYVFGVYKFIPKNRGGGLPVTEIYFDSSNHKMLLSELASFSPIIGFGPFYIVEENSDFLFLASAEMEKWTIDYVPIFVMRKSHLDHIFIRRIPSGFPRTISSASSSRP
ncbi:MAG: hypothetical protein H6852_05225 [Geminicoccaceae bacterium]|nr:hypothetical protein [Geminicoccaceae bacterium]HRY24219.1 hypothetical protein [Geminicoccaceae bacterium]